MHQIGAIGRITRRKNTEPNATCLRRIDLFALGIALLGLAQRLYQASTTYLDPDEAQNFYLSIPGNLWQFLRGDLSSNHPPLLLFWLHGVMQISTSEMALRIIAVLAGVAFPLVM